MLLDKMSKVDKKRLLFVIPYDYYLFSFYPILLEKLQDLGFQVTVFTISKAVINSYKSRGIQIKEFPYLLKFFHKISGYSLVRPLSWCFFYSWAYKNRKNFDLAVVPWDNKLIFCSLIKFMKSMTIHCTVNFVDLEIELEGHKSNKKHLFVSFLEKITGFSLMPRLMGQVMSHSMDWYIDKFMGLRSKNLQQGFSNVDLLTVTGHKIKENYIKAGLGEIKPEIHVVGNPSYEGYLEYSQKFKEEDKLRFKKELEVSQDEDLFTLFLSPTRFTKIQIKEIVTVVREIKKYDEKCFICIKFHPKAEEIYIDEIEKKSLEIAKKLKVIREFKGDDFNLDLILSSKAIIQKQCTVGFISMIAKKPIISYDLYETNFMDDLYKTLGCSFHSESLDALRINLKKLDNNHDLKKLYALQKDACNNYCLSINSPSKRISKVINDFLGDQ